MTDAVPTTDTILIRVRVLGQEDGEANSYSCGVAFLEQSKISLGVKSSRRIL
jgi:hypothetical protein